MNSVTMLHNVSAQQKYCLNTLVNLQFKVNCKVKGKAKIYLLV